ncbi:hypothetical protein [Streptomyces anulatus]|uniref:hypothetical protein n=1 Tax=Streptomyces anulatus TaxID=1892 RepID=UPI00224DB8D9|nr:hypothetical protein [Streptomyces anulatus]MCX4502958.1 hypothetical protein [Streptomyces anulatus]
MPGAWSVKAVPPRCAGGAVAERWTVAPGAVPEDAGCRGPALGPPPVRPSAGPGDGAPAPGCRTSRRQVAATTGRAVLPPAVAFGGAENPSAEPVFTVRARPESRVRDRWTEGDGVVPLKPCAAVRPRATGRTRTGCGGAAAAGAVRLRAGSAVRWTAGVPGDDAAGVEDAEDAEGTGGATEADRTGIAEGASAGAGA